VLRPGRQAHIPQPRQKLADRALVHRDAEQVFDLPLEVDAPPTHDAVPVRIRASLNKRGDLRLLFRAEQGRPARRFPVAQSLHALGVVTVDPVPEGLPVHAARLGSVRTIRSFQHQRNRQKPPRRLGILQASRLAPKLGR